MNNQEIVTLVQETGIFIWDMDKDGEWIRFVPANSDLDIPDLRFIWYLNKSDDWNMARLTKKSFELGKAHTGNEINKIIGRYP